MNWHRMGIATALALLAAGCGDPLPLSAVVNGAALRRCAECGYVESRRANEYTVRMVDGSKRVFTEDPSVSWRVGERLIVID
jgi:hypothetical protein